MATHYSDGDFTEATPTGADVRHMPFLNIGNQSNYMIERFIMQNIASKAVVPLGTAATADDGGNSDTGDTLYLINESPLDQGLAAVGQARYSRLWAPQWADITVYDGLSFPLPDFRGLVYPGITFTYDDTKLRLAILLDPLIPESVSYWTAGTWTYTGPVSSTESAAVNFDDNSLTATAALQAVDPIVSNVSKVTNPGVDPSSPFWMDRLYRDTSLANETPTFDLSGLTPAGAFERETSTSNSFRKITITVTAGDLIAGTWTFTSEDGLVVATINYDDDAETILSKLQVVDTCFDSVTIDNSTNFEISLYYAKRQFNGAGNGYYVLNNNVKAAIDISGLSHNGSGIAKEEAADTGILERLTVYPSSARITKAAHKLQTGDLVYVSPENFVVTRIDANTFDVALEDYNHQIALPQYQPIYYWYTRAKQVRSRFIFKFYILGVTPGITTPADIPSPAVVDHDYALLEALANQTEEITIGVTKPVIIFPGVYQVRLTNVSIFDLYDES